jgi:hypothetical protein
MVEKGDNFIGKASQNVTQTLSIVFRARHSVNNCQSFVDTPEAKLQVANRHSDVRNIHEALRELFRLPQNLLRDQFRDNASRRLGCRLFFPSHDLSPCVRIYPVRTPFLFGSR